jgi:hypothetical protein
MEAAVDALQKGHAGDQPVEGERVGRAEKAEDPS